MDDQNIMVNGEPLKEYIEQQEGWEIQDDVRDEKQCLKKQLYHPPYNPARKNGAWFDARKYRHGTVKTLTKEEIERLQMKQKTSQIYEILLKMVGKPMLPIRDFFTVPGTHGSVNTGLAQLVQLVPEYVQRQYTHTPSASGGRNTRGAAQYGLTQKGHTTGVQTIYDEFLERRKLHQKQFKHKKAPVGTVVSTPKPTDTDPILWHATVKSSKRYKQDMLKVRELLAYFDPNNIDLVRQVPWVLLMELNVIVKEWCEDAQENVK